MFNETSPLTYGTEFEVYTNCDTPFTLYRNGSSITNDSVQSLGAGTYNFTVLRTDTENYSNVRSEEVFTINKVQSIVETYVKETRGNITINRGNTINLNGTLILGEGPIKLYFNGTLINEGYSPLSNSTLFNFLGTFNVSTIYEETENYTYGFETFIVRVQNPSSGGSSSPSKSNPTFGYEFDCETGILDVESERSLEIRLMSLVDYSTYKNTTNDNGIVSFTLAIDGTYRIYTESTSDYYSTTREVDFEFCKEEIINETENETEIEIPVPDLEVNETEDELNESENTLKDEIQEMIYLTEEEYDFSSNLEAQEMFNEAKRLFDTGDYEGARDLINAAIDLLLESEAQQPDLDNDGLEGNQTEIPGEEEVIEKPFDWIPYIITALVLLFLIWLGFKYIRKREN